MTEVTQTGGSFPDGHPDMWFVEAVPFSIQLLRYLQVRLYDNNNVSNSAAKEMFRRLIADLEMGEDASVDLVRDVCLETHRRIEKEVH